jgi:hypothetical protein
MQLMILMYGNEAHLQRVKHVTESKKLPCGTAAYSLRLFSSLAQVLSAA